jgi:predicted TIM-barrel fold metal-dependent hydrolase
LAFLKLFEKGRIWVKMTAPYRITQRDVLPYDDVDAVARMLREARADRLLWGTDWPHPINPKPMANDGDKFDHLAEWLPGEGLLRQVLVENPKTLYGFD